MEIKDHLLREAGISFIPSPNLGQDFPSDPDTIVLHYTAGGNADSAVQTFKNPLTRTSAHLIIGQDGKVIQMVPFNKIAWHAGESQYEGRTGFNKYSIGIEIDNAGPLEKRRQIFIMVQ
jgi:N-acetylmuramoyl-L-alanine amidase